MIAQAVYNILTGDSTLTTALGHTASVKKIWGVVATQNTVAPLMTFRTASTEPEDHKQGSNIENHTLVVDIYHTGYLSAHLVAGYVKDALDRYSGTSGGSDIDTIIYEGLSDRAYEVDREEFHVELTFNIREKT